MATDKTFMEYVMEQIHYNGELRYRMMFGEYAIYADDKLFALVCDNKLFIKPTETGRMFIGNVNEAPPYPGTKNSFLIEEQLEDREWLSELVAITVKALPPPKKKKSKK